MLVNDYFNHMKNQRLLWTGTVALAGFLFGFDTVVISGANLPIKELWQTSGFFHSTFIMSMALWGTVIGALFGGIPCDKLGRKKTLFWIGVLYAVSALGSALAPDPFSFSFFRFLGGLGVGASSVAAPIYISEISPAAQRGRLVAQYQFMIVFGIFVAFISNYLLQGFGGEQDWRWMLGVEALPAIVYCVMVARVPNSPRWLLMHKKDETGARSIMEQLGFDDVSAAIDKIMAPNAIEKVKSGIWSGKYKWPLLLAFLLAFFNQLSGINFILYYAPEILEKAGLAAKESLFSSIFIGGINLIFTMMGMYLIDRWGRKQLMLLGSVGYIISLSMVAYAFYASSSSVFLLSFLLLFIASHAIGQGAVIWVFISEIFPNKVRAAGQAWGSGVHWVFAALITLLGTPTLEYFAKTPWYIFIFFALFMVFQLLFVLFMMPETKGKSLEQLEVELGTR